MFNKKTKRKQKSQISLLNKLFKLFYCECICKSEVQKETTLINKD